MGGIHRHEGMIFQVDGTNLRNLTVFQLRIFSIIDHLCYLDDDSVLPGSGEDLSLQVVVRLIDTGCH